MSDLQITFNLNFGPGESKQSAKAKSGFYGEIDITISQPSSGAIVPAASFVADGWVSDPNASMTASLGCSGPTPPQLTVHVDKNQTDGDGNYFWYTDSVNLQSGVKYCLMVMASDIATMSSGSKTVFFSTAV